MHHSTGVYKTYANGKIYNETTAMKEVTFHHTKTLILVNQSKEMRIRKNNKFSWFHFSDLHKITR